ncbi:aldo/keto reductase [Micromonospora sp. WMMD730]|uniref:aldo/keto reductase n=1 Tax=Micromonospora sp. WMMD730 TaxID=3404128 RepID=UPI003B955801
MPAYQDDVRRSRSYSLARLGVDHVDIHRPARLDRSVPIEDTIGAIKDMIDAGYVRFVGLSEVDAQTVRRAHAAHPVVDLQIEYSLLSRAVEAEVLPALRESGIGLTAHGVLGRGLLSGNWVPGRADDPRNHAPRFSAENASHNQTRSGGGVAPGRRWEGVEPSAGDPEEIEAAVPKGTARGDRYPRRSWANLGVGNRRLDGQP